MMGPLKAAAGIFHDCPFQLIHTSGFYDRGVYKRQGTTITWHKGDFQPAGERDIQRLPEGSRADGAMVLFTCLELQTAESPNAVADRVVYKGALYEVSGLNDWQSHNRYTLTKVGQ